MNKSETKIIADLGEGWKMVAVSDYFNAGQYKFGSTAYKAVHQLLTEPPEHIMKKVRFILEGLLPRPTSKFGERN